MTFLPRKFIKVITSGDKSHELSTSVPLKVILQKRGKVERNLNSKFLKCPNLINKRCVHLEISQSGINVEHEPRRKDMQIFVTIV